jgi:hypothetical protein
MIDRIHRDCLKGKLDELKELYVRFLLLLDRSLSEPIDGVKNIGRTTATPIEALVRDIEGKAADFHAALAESDDWRAAVDPPLREEIERFSEGLRDGLAALKSRADERIALISAERDRVRDRLEELRTQQTRRQGHRGPGAPPSALIDSQA